MRAFGELNWIDVFVAVALSYISTSHHKVGTISPPSYSTKKPTLSRAYKRLEAIQCRTQNKLLKSRKRNQLQLWAYFQKQTVIIVIWIAQRWRHSGSEIDYNLKCLVMKRRQLNHRSLTNASGCFSRNVEIRTQSKRSMWGLRGRNKWEKVGNLI